MEWRLVGPFRGGRAVSAELETELNALDALLKQKLGEINEQGRALGVWILSERLERKAAPPLIFS